MIHLYFVGDGPRDEATLPCLVERLLGYKVSPSFPERPHVRLNGSGGYRGQIRFAIRAARDADAGGIVVFVDADKDRRGRKFRELRAGRDDYLASAPPFPTALGEADPHAEAWLLDDQVAVRQVLGLSPDVGISTIRQTKSPKATLQLLIDQSEIKTDDLLAILAAIAREVDPSRCRHAKETGFKKFADEVRHELGPLVPKR